MYRYSTWGLAVSELLAQRLESANCPNFFCSIFLLLTNRIVQFTLLAYGGIKKVYKALCDLSHRETQTASGNECYILVGSAVVLS